MAIFFLMKKPSRRKCVKEAWEIFATSCNPFYLKNSELYHGEVPAPLPEAENEYCIAVRSEDPAVMKYLRDVFSSCDHPSLAPLLDRVREAGVIEKYGLERRGKVRSDGCFETPEWNRPDHDLCKLAGWPYVPLKIPEHIRPEPLEELEKMGKPDRRASGSFLEEHGLKRAPFLGPKRARGALKRLAARSIAITLLAVVTALIWTRRDDITLRLRYGAEGVAKRKRGYAVAGIANIPRDLDLHALNKKLEEKAYYAVKLRNKSLADVWLNCTIWFSTNEEQDPFLTTTVQAFVKPEMESADGKGLWASQGKGTRSAPGSEKENPHLRRDALLAAIADMDLRYLPDGRSVRSFQANNDFAGLRVHVFELLGHATGQDGQMERQAGEQEQAITKEIDEGSISVSKKICECLLDKWVMTHRIRLTRGEELDVVILQETQTALKVRARLGIATIEKGGIEDIQPLTKQQLVENIHALLEPVKGEFTTVREHEDCTTFVNELGDKYSTYGVPFPGACTLKVLENKTTGLVTAVVRTAKGRTRVQTGDRIDDFEIVGIDPETKTVALRMGEGGEVLRIWPRLPSDEN